MGMIYERNETMFTSLVNKLVVKNEKKGLDQRETIGAFASVVGAISNILLFLVKLIVGIVSGSISITADSINNLSDTGASIVSLIGFRIGRKPADEEHPFGHGRIEYISAFIVSMLILALGFEFLVTSIKRIFSPEPIEMTILMYVVLLGTILAKVWQSLFYKHYGKKISSDALMAVSKDSYFDVIITSATVLSAFVYDLTGLRVDGISGVFVAVMLLYAGYEIARDTLSPLLGEKPDSETVKGIKGIVEKNPYILRTHDLVIHNYGPTESMATIHAEMSNTLPIEDVHKAIHEITDVVNDTLGIHLIIHVDPVDTKCKDLQELRKAAEELLAGYEGVSAHEFAWIVEDIEASFEMTFTLDYSEDEKEEIIQKLKSLISSYGFDSQIRVTQSIT